MSLSIVHSRAQIGVDAPAVTVEVHLANGLPSLTMVGLPEAAVKESKDRVRSAIINSGLQFPARRITLNLAPADLPKDGGRFDLAIALGILSASVQVPTLTLDDIECLGELALSGAVRAVRGVLPAALAARKAGRSLMVPRANAEEACLASGLKVFAVDHLLEAVAHFNGHTPVEPYVSNGLLYASKPYPDLNEVQGQLSAKRALLIAAAGAHNLLFSGPPGTGKTLLASRLPGLLPPLAENEALEVAAIQSVTSCVPLSHWPQRPFRQPHHSASGPALVGGGSKPQPGEITLAHHGVLFLDELPEFDRKVLEVLREPLESGHIVISRAKDRVRFPARFQLVAAFVSEYSDQGDRNHSHPRTMPSLTLKRHLTSVRVAGGGTTKSRRVQPATPQLRMRRRPCANPSDFRAMYLPVRPLCFPSTHLKILWTLLYPLPRDVTLALANRRWSRSH
ncbi:Competence protein ComM [Pseudomonas fluorescens]|nr:Competence protein ComM [Pseudomonas fluorescens]